MQHIDGWVFERASQSGKYFKMCSLSRASWHSNAQVLILRDSAFTEKEGMQEIIVSYHPMTPNDFLVFLNLQK